VALIPGQSPPEVRIAILIHLVNDYVIVEVISGHYLFRFSAKVIKKEEKAADADK
jgi:hypothetical protein